MSDFETRYKGRFLIQRERREATALLREVASGEMESWAADVEDQKIPATQQNQQRHSAFSFRKPHPRQ